MQLFFILDVLHLATCQLVMGIVMEQQIPLDTGCNKIILKYLKLLAKEINSIQLVRCTKEWLTLLIYCEFNLVATVCDQGRRNVAAINFLIKETHRSLYKGELFMYICHYHYAIYELAII